MSPELSLLTSLVASGTCALFAVLVLFNWLLLRRQVRAEITARLHRDDLSGVARRATWDDDIRGI